MSHNFPLLLRVIWVFSSCVAIVIVIFEGYRIYLHGYLRNTSNMKICTVRKYLRSQYFTVKFKATLNMIKCR